VFRTKKNFQSPVNVIVHLIGNKWKVVILRSLVGGTKRFEELRREIPGISQKVLTHTLCNMEKDGLVKRKAYPVVPPKVEYSLTSFAKDLCKLLLNMAEWGLKYCELKGIPMEWTPPVNMADLEKE
jgi:DNA-binding HxlR family transcriptional regulator